ncbi:MAG: hypothetical protein KGL19_14175 [Bacteroidota bacterium]|nr:hypothetical protein [Bacteroidota bacterium]
MKGRITLLFLMITIIATAQQKNWVSAEITYKSGEKVEGKVDYKEWVNNPQIIVFSTASGSMINLTPGQVKIVDIKGSDIYKGVLIKRYNNKIENSQVTEDDDEPFIEDTIFLRLLSSGPKLKLYSYKDDIKTNYFIEDSTANLFALRYVRFLLKDGTQIDDKPIYKNQLQRFVINDSKNQRLLLNTRWKDDEMIKLVKTINGSSDFSYAENDLNKTKKNSYFFAGAGITILNFGITSSSNPYWNGMSFNTNYSPTAMIGYHINGGRNMSRFGMNLVLSGFNINTTGKYYWIKNGNETITETLIYKSFDLSLSPEFEYSILKNESFEIHLGIGFKITSSLGVNSNYTTTELNITGQPLNREQLATQNGTFIHTYAFGEFNFLKRNTFKLAFCPSQKVEDIGATKPHQQYIMLGYYFSFRK